MAFKDAYGYDWQGDSILLARENLLFSYVDYYKARFGGKVPKGEELCEIAEILSWNIWQMDGLNYSTEVTAYTQQKQFFNDRAEVIAFCNERGIRYHIMDGTITE